MLILLRCFSLVHLAHSLLNSPLVSPHRWKRVSLKASFDESLYEVNQRDEAETRITSVAFDVAGRRMKLETGKIGRQASGSVTAQVENTIVYSTVCTERESKPVDFTPLRVDYFARYSAVGQTVGAFHRRDSRGDDGEILVARLIDRPLRPMIAEGWQHETQVLAWVLAYDKILSPEPLAICAASAAMCVSEVPMSKPIAGVEIALSPEGAYIVNPTNAEKAASPMQITVAGTKEGILMIEGAGDFVPDEVMLDAISAGHAAIGTICDGIELLQRCAGKPKKTDTLRRCPVELLGAMDAMFGEQMVKALSIGDKQKRGGEVAAVERMVIERFCNLAAPAAPTVAVKVLGESSSEVGGAADEAVRTESDEALVVVIDPEDAVVADEPVGGADELSEDEASELAMRTGVVAAAASEEAMESAGYKYDAVDVKVSMKKLLVRCLRRLICGTGSRSDGRGTDEVRPIYVETALLPTTHGSSLFTRGETQALATATLGGKGMEARIETLDAVGTKRFYLQYRFPPSSVGEVGRVGGINRREVGHGNLAERALLPAIPPTIVFPYAIRAESLITESCGSSSMATVCGCCLAMLDAGVPLTSHVAGVAMGLILGETIDEEPLILTDILGLEDALGTMDFKVAGNESGITSFQLDIKSEGLTLGVLRKALAQAKRGRLHVLGLMRDHISGPRKLKDSVPKILEISVPTAVLGKVIGPKGATIQKLIETFKLINIAIEDNGSVQIESFLAENNEAARDEIMRLISDTKEVRGGSREGPPPEEGTIYRNCSIVSVHAFGVFVVIVPGYEGLVPTPELDIIKITKPETVFSPGQLIDVKYIGLNQKGQMRLSRRAVLLRDAAPALSNLPSDMSSDNITDVETKEQVLKVGTVYENVPIVGITGFGVFVELLPGVEGLVHASELDVKRVSTPASHFSLGQRINVKYLADNDDGKRVLSRKATLNEEGSSKMAEAKGDPPVEGQIYRGCPIKTITKFGVFIAVVPGYDGLVHVSELDVKSITDVEAVFKIGQLIDVKHIGFNEKGQMRLSRKAALVSDQPSQETVAQQIVS